MELNKSYTIRGVANELRVGDWVKTNGDGIQETIFFEGEIGEISETVFYVWQNTRFGRAGKINPKTKNYNFSWMINKDNDGAVITLLKRGEVCGSSIKPAYEPLKNIMSSIIDFARDLILSGDEKLLRKHGLKNSCGEYTGDAEKLVINKIVKENEAYLIEVAKKKEEAEK